VKIAVQIVIAAAKLGVLSHVNQIKIVEHMNIAHSC